MLSIKHFILILAFIALPLTGDYWVCIDPGHCGNSDGGAPGLNDEEEPDESDFNLFIAIEAYNELETYLNRSVLMTRHYEDNLPPPRAVSPLDKANMANGLRPNDLGERGLCYCAVSIHNNSTDPYPSPAHGTETYFSGLWGNWNNQLADYVHAALCDWIDHCPYFEDREVQQKHLDFLRNTWCPSCLPEVAFVSHPDGPYFPGQWNQLQYDLFGLKTFAGIGIAHGVDAFLGSLFPPVYLKLYRSGRANVELTWDPSASPGVNYNIYRRKHPSSTFILIGSNITGTNYTDNSVENGETYSYYVTAVSGEVESVRSNVLAIVLFQHMWDTLAKN